MILFLLRKISENETFCHVLTNKKYNPKQIKVLKTGNNTYLLQEIAICPTDEKHWNAKRI